jgi:hypothetical protein
MEIFLQYWDDLDDAVGVIGLYMERLRRLALFALATLFFILLLAIGMYAALREPPLALAMATMLAVCLMYRSVTSSVVSKRTS